MRGSWRPNRTATYWPPLLWPSAFLFRSPVLLNRRPGGPLCCVLAFSTASCHQRVWSPKLTDFLSSLSYIIVQSPTQYLPITDHRNLSLPPSLEWHVWSSSSGNNCYTLHRSLSSGASVCTVGFKPCPILSAQLAHANEIYTSAVFGRACLAGSEVNIQHIEMQCRLQIYNRDTSRGVMVKVSN